MNNLHIQWCSVCNAAPSDGNLTVLIEGYEETIPACSKCVHDESKVRFV